MGIANSTPLSDDQIREAAKAERKAKVTAGKKILKSQVRELDKEIRRAQLEETKSRNEMRTLLKKNNITDARIIGSNVNRNVKLRARLETSKAAVQAYMHELENQSSQLAMVGVITDVGAFMKSQNTQGEGLMAFVKIQDFEKQLRDAGFIAEQVGESVDAALGDAGTTDAETDKEINALIAEEQAKMGSIAAGMGSVSAQQTRVDTGENNAAAWAAVAAGGAMKL